MTYVKKGKINSHVPHCHCVTCNNRDLDNDKTKVNATKKLVSPYRALADMKRVSATLMSHPEKLTVGYAASLAYKIDRWAELVKDAY